MKPVNSSSVFDRGFISPLHTTFSDKKIEILELFSLPEKSKGRLREEWSEMSFMMRVPVFILTKLVNYNVQVIHCREAVREFFVPTEAEIGGADLQTARLILQDIEEISSKLEITPKSYQSDGCRPDVSMILSPVSTYVTFLIKAKTVEWEKIAKELDEKTLSRQFASVLKSIIKSEVII